MFIDKQPNVEPAAAAPVVCEYHTNTVEKPQNSPPPHPKRDSKLDDMAAMLDELLSTLPKPGETDPSSDRTSLSDHADGPLLPPPQIYVVKGHRRNQSASTADTTLSSVNGVESMGGSSIDITDFFQMKAEGAVGHGETSGLDHHVAQNSAATNGITHSIPELSVTKAKLMSEQLPPSMATGSGKRAPLRKPPIRIVISRTAANIDDVDETTSLQDTPRAHTTAPRGKDLFSDSFATAAETSRAELPVASPPPPIADEPSSLSLSTPTTGAKRQQFRKFLKPRPKKTERPTTPSVQINGDAIPSNVIEDIPPSEPTTPTTSTHPTPHPSDYPDLGLPRVRRRSHVYSQRRSISHTNAVADNTPLDIDALAGDSDESDSGKNLVPFEIAKLHFDPLSPHLDISSRNLSHFPALPAQFNGLVELHLVNNWITAIPGSILGRLERLQVLDLSQNLLAQLPAEIGGLRELREVYVRENRLVGLPVELADAGRLRVCDFGRNRITDIAPELFAHMPHLTTLDLSHNCLRILPSSIGVLRSSLHTLYVQGNPFDTSFAQIVAPLLAVTQASGEVHPVSNAGVGVSTPPSVASSIHLDDSPLPDDLPPVDDPPPTPTSSTASHPKRRIQSLPSDGWRSDHLLKLEKMIGGTTTSPIYNNDTPLGSVRSVQSRTSARHSIAGDAFPWAPTAESVISNPTPNSSFRSRNSESSRRRGIVGLFGGGNGDAASGSGVVQQERRSSVGAMDRPPSVVDGGGEKLAVADAAAGKGRLFGIGKRKSVLVRKSAPPGSLSFSTPDLPTTPSKSPDYGPRRSSLDPSSALDDPRPSSRPTSSSTTRTRRFSNLFSSPKQSPPTKTSPDTATQYRNALLQLLNHLRDAHTLDPRTSAAAASLLSPSPSASLPDTESDPKHLSKKQTPERRRKVAMEVLTTERTYVSQLEALREVYIVPMEEGGVLSAQEMNGIFANLGSLLLFHRDHLLPDLERACSAEDQPLGSVFLPSAPFLRMYSTYYNNFDSANRLVSQIDSPSSASTSAAPPPSSNSTTALPTTDGSSKSTKKALNKRLKEFVQEAKQNPRHTQNSLQSFLILPVQRLPRYKLLIDELFECTPPTHTDYASLKRAREEIRLRVAECNDKKREWEAREQGLNVLSRVRVRPWSAGVDAFAHVRPGRRFVRQGMVRVLKSVEFVGAATGHMRVDALQACGGKKERFRQGVAGHLIETRFGVKDGEETAGGSDALGRLR